MSQAKTKLGAVALALLAGTLAVLLWRLPRLGSGVRMGTPPPGVTEAPRPPPVQAAAASAAGPEGRSGLADRLNSPDGDAKADLRLVNAIFVAYRTALRCQNPVGENSEITSALRGRNKLGFAFIPADNPAINAKGELCDRWGTPYFFHQLSGERMEIRSAGPDRRLWTGDDVVLTP